MTRDINGGAVTILYSISNKETVDTVSSVKYKGPDRRDVIFRVAKMISCLGIIRLGGGG